MKRSMKIMTKIEKRDFILLPIIMALVCILLGAVMSLVAITEGKPDLVYVMCIIAGLFFVYGASIWWESLRTWRNGEGCRRGLKKEDPPEEKEKK